MSPLEPRYLAVRNWDKFQHYKQRNPPWIRLHRTLLRDHKFNQLTETEQWMLVRMWLLASESDNHMAYDEKWVRRAINSSRKVPLEKFVSMGFLEEVGERLASTVLAECEQLAEPEAEKRREEKPSKPTPVDNRSESEAEFFTTVADWGLHHSQIVRALRLGIAGALFAMQKVKQRQDVGNKAAYFDSTVKDMLAAQEAAGAARSEMPLAERLLIYVRNAGWELTHAELAEELAETSADEALIASLLVTAEQLRRDAA